MPLYDFTCPRGHVFETFLKMSDPTDRVRCPKCRRSRCVRVPSGSRIQRTWHGDESESMCERFDPAGIAELKREIPSIEINARGNPVYRNDAHQRRCYAEAQATMRRYREESEAKGDPRIKEHA